MLWYLMTSSCIIIFSKNSKFITKIWYFLIKAEYYLIKALLLCMTLSLISKQNNNNCSYSHIKKTHTSTAHIINQFCVFSGNMNHCSPTGWKWDGSDPVSLYVGTTDNLMKCK